MLQLVMRMSEATDAAACRAVTVTFARDRQLPMEIMSPYSPVSQSKPKPD